MIIGLMDEKKYKIIKRKEEKIIKNEINESHGVPVLVYDHEVCDVVGAASVHQLVELVAAPVQPLRSREQQPKLLNKALEGGDGR